MKLYRSFLVAAAAAVLAACSVGTAPQFDADWASKMATRETENPKGR